MTQTDTALVQIVRHFSNVKHARTFGAVRTFPRYLGRRSSPVHATHADRYERIGRWYVAQWTARFPAYRGPESLYGPVAYRGKVA